MRKPALLQFENVRHTSRKKFTLPYLNLTIENIAWRGKRHGMWYILMDSDSGRMEIEQSGSS